jgi:hypothetical protein
VHLTEPCDQESIRFVGLGTGQLALSKGVDQAGVDDADRVPALVQECRQGVAIGSSRLHTGADADGGPVLFQPLLQQLKPGLRVGEDSVARLVALGDQGSVEFGFGQINSQEHQVTSWSRWVCLACQSAL